MRIQQEINKRITILQMLSSVIKTPNDFPLADLFNPMPENEAEQLKKLNELTAGAMVCMLAYHQSLFATEYLHEQNSPYVRDARTQLVTNSYYPMTPGELVNRVSGPVPLKDYICTIGQHVLAGELPFIDLNVILDIEHKLCDEGTNVTESGKLTACFEELLELIPPQENIKNQFTTNMIEADFHRIMHTFEPNYLRHLMDDSHNGHVRSVNTPLIKKIDNLKKATVARFHNIPKHFESDEYNSILAGIRDLTTKLREGTLTKQDIEDFKQEMSAYKLSPGLACAIELVIGALIGLIAGVAIGCVIGTGIPVIGVIGAAIGAGWGYSIWSKGDAVDEVISAAEPFSRPAS